MRSCSRSAAGVCATVRVGLAGLAGRGRGGLEPVDIAAGGQAQSRAQQGGRSPKAAACPSLAPSRTPRHVSYSYLAGGLIPAQHFNLPHPEHLDSRPAPRLDPAADPNPSIFEGLKARSRRPRTPATTRLEIVTAKSRVQFRPKFR